MRPPSETVNADIVRPAEPTTFCGGRHGKSERRSSKAGNGHGKIKVPGEEDESIVWFDWNTFMAYSGPGLLMSIAYLDPGNLEADLQQGAYTGFSLVWVLLLGHGTGFVLQRLAARLGNVTGKHLAQISSAELPRGLSLILYVAAEIAIIAADVQEILGSAIALGILFHIPLWAGCLITFLDTILLLSMDCFGVRRLEALFGVMVGTMSICFFLNYGADPPATSDVAHGIIPYVHRYALTPAIGAFGAIVMPHNIFLHSALVLTRSVDRTQIRQIKIANKYCALDAGLSLTLCFFINLFVVGSFAQNFFNPHCAASATTSACVGYEYVAGGAATYGTCTSIHGEHGVCAEIGLKNAGDALEFSLGKYAKYVWAIGLLAAGQSATLTTTYAGQFVMEGFLNADMPSWLRILVTRSIALIPAMVVAWLQSSSALMFDSMNQWINVLQSLMLPFALLPVLLFTDSWHLMGEFRNHWTMSTLCWVLVSLIIAANAKLIYGEIISDDDGSLGNNITAHVVGAAFIYLSALIWLVWHMQSKQHDEAAMDSLPDAHAVQANDDSMPTYGSTS